MTDEKEKIKRIMIADKNVYGDLTKCENCGGWHFTKSKFTCKEMSCWSDGYDEGSKQERLKVLSEVEKMIENANGEYSKYVIRANSEPIPTHFDIWLTAISHIKDKIQALKER